MNPYEDGVDSEESEKTKKQWGLNVLILAGVFLLSAVLPSEYKAFAPALFIIPLIAGIVKKIRRSGENPENPSQDNTYSPPIPDRIPTHEPYSYTPKDPKDPRRYKPIG